ncbi:MAG: hypothetical protein JXB24_14155 [Bacteroidales bacterium]|nr:hypothetical protein [Bacteroidales bacterium]
MKGIRFNLLFGILVIAGVELSAQVNTLYYMPGVPQSYYMNPATQPGCNIFIGVPAISSWYLEAYNSSIGLSDLFWNDAETGEVLHPFHPDADSYEFVEKFDDKNYLSSELAFNLISFGFRIRKMYFTFDITARTKEQLIYPDDLLDFVITGNTNGETFDFSDTRLELTEHIEYGIGISRTFGDQFIVGIRPKILSGLAAINWDNSHMDLYTTRDEWLLNSDASAQICIPGMTIPTNADGTIDLDREMEFDSTLNSFQDYRKLFSGNMGMGIDLGVHYNPMEELQISFSVLDLGYIKWKNYTQTVSLEGTYSYTGVMLDADSTFTYDILDTITTHLDLSSSSGSFRTTLDPKMFLSARYSLVPQFDMGFVHRFDFPKEGLKYSLTLMANYRPSHMVSISGSYTPLGGNAKSFGLGLSVNLGFFNLYFISDYLTPQYNLVENVVLLDGINKYTFRYGVNLVFGCNQKKKLRKDKPMYYSDEY